jgi:hypothetical protein
MLTNINFLPQSLSHNFFDTCKIVGLPILLDQVIFRAFRDQYPHRKVLTAGTLAGLITIILLGKEPLKGSAIFLAYKIVLLVMRAHRLAQIKKEIADCLQKHESELTKLDSDHHDSLQYILLLDRTRNLGVINTAINQIMQAHQLTFQQMELFLRQNNCYTYLIARKRNSDHSAHVRFVCPRTQQEKNYHLFISTRNQDEALSELLEESSTYQENLDKLKDTGVMRLQEHLPLADHFHGGTLLLHSG